MEGNRFKQAPQIALLLSNVDGATVQRNRISRPADYGMAVIEGEFNQLFKNKIKRSFGIGLGIYSSNNNIVKNKVNKSGMVDLLDDDPAHNLYRGNRFGTTN